MICGREGDCGLPDLKAWVFRVGDNHRAESGRQRKDAVRQITYTILVTIAADSPPPTLAVEQQVQQALEEGTRDWPSHSAAMVHVYHGDHVAPANEIVRREQDAHRDLREGR